MPGDPLPPLEMIELDVPEGEPARVRRGQMPGPRRWLAGLLVAGLALGAVIALQRGDASPGKTSPTTLEPSIDQGPFSENLVPFERRATSTTSAPGPMVPNAVGTSLVIVRGRDVAAIDLATGGRRQIAVVDDESPLVPMRGGVAALIDGEARHLSVRGGEPVVLGRADGLVATEQDDAVWLVSAPGLEAGSATLVDPSGKLLAGPLDVPGTTTVHAATSRWLLLQARGRSYLLGLDGTLRPGQVSDGAAPVGADAVAQTGCDEAARCGPEVYDLATGARRPLTARSTGPVSWGRLVAEDGGSRVAVVRRGARPEVIVLGPDGTSSVVPDAVRDPAWLRDGLGLLALADAGEVMHWTPDGTTRALDLTLDAASRILVVRD